MDENQNVFFKNARNSYLIVDDKSLILNANESLLSLFNYNLNDIINKDISLLFKTKDNILESILQVLKSKDTLTLANIYCPLLKKFFFLHIFYLNKNKAGIDIEDTSEKRRFKEQLIANENKFEEFNNFKENLLSNLNHELRTPLNGIIGYSQLLQLEISNPAQNDMINMIYESGNRLLATLNSILMLSELESDKLKINLDDIHLFSVVKSIVLAFEEICSSKGLELKIETKDKNIFARIDEYLFYKLLANILGNAIKFTEKGKVIVEIDSCKDNGQLYGIVKVKDTGIGIDDDQMKYIYSAFRQGSEGMSRKYGGVGLGLTLSKKLVEFLDGKIDIDSTLNKGTVVTLKFIGSYNSNWKS